MATPCTHCGRAIRRAEDGTWVHFESEVRECFGWPTYASDQRYAEPEDFEEAVPDNPAWQNPDGSVNHAAIAAEWDDDLVYERSADK